MTRSGGLAVVLAAGLAAHGAAQIPNRQVHMPPTPDFVPGYQARQGRQTIVEFVPRGQTVRNFTRMITLQTMPVAPGMTAGSALTRFGQSYVQRCPRAAARPVPLGGGASGIRIDCPRHPATGRAETVFARAIAMPPEMALVHITTKYFTMPAEAGWARDYLGKVGIR